MSSPEIRNQPIEQYNCGICRSKSLTALFFATDRNFQSTNERFLVVKCRNCGVAQTLPQPKAEEIPIYYPEYYYPKATLPAPAYERMICRYQREKSRHVARFVKRGRLLDVGCGVGYFVKQAVQSGYEAEGVEFNKETVSFGCEHLGVNITCGDIFLRQLQSSSYDIITFWHSLEHMLSPKDVLQRARELLKPGGLLVVAVPNIESLQAKLFRKNWYHLEIPRHLFHFDPKALSSLVQEIGFEIKTINYFSKEHNWAGYLGSMMLLAPENESLWHKIMRKTIGLHLTKGLAFLESSIKQGGTFQLYAIKK